MALFVSRWIFICCGAADYSAGYCDELFYTQMEIRGISSAVLGKAKACVSAAEAKAVAQGDIHLMLLRRFGDIVAVKVMRGIARAIKIERRWQNVLELSEELQKLSSAEALTLPMDSIVKIASTAPAAPRRWPIAPLLLLMFN